MGKIRARQSDLNQNQQIQFLRDFDLLTSISDQQAALYLPANIDVGETLMKQNFVLKQDGSQYSLRCDINQFKQFGPGIYLLFKLLKYLTVVFGIMSVLALALVVLLVQNQVKHQDQINNSFTSGILKVTLHNLTRKNFTPYVVFDYIITVFLSIALIFWCEKQKSYTIQCLNSATLASYFTIIVRKLPQNYNQHLLTQYLQKEFGDVNEIYTVRNFGDDLLYYKQMSQVVQDYKQQKALIKLDKDRNCDRLINIFFEFRKGHKKLKQKILNSQNSKPCFTFAQFTKIQDRDKILQWQQQRQYSNVCWKLYKKNNIQSIKNNNNDQNNPNQIIHDRISNKDKHLSQSDFQQLQIVQCQMQPCGILWQNLHLTNASIAARTCAMILMMVVLMIISIFLIILLSVMEMSIMNSKFKDVDRETVVKTQDSFALLSYCVNLSLSAFYQHYDICSHYRTQYFKCAFMSFLVPFSISIFKLILTELMKGFVNYRRYAYQIKKVQSQALIIFVFYFAVTGIFQLIIYLGNNSYSLFNLFTPLIQTLVNQDFSASKIQLFPDYVPNWYATSAQNILLIGIISFNLSAVGIILYCQIRNKIFRYYAKKQKIQIQMNTWLHGYTLEIQYVYAAILTIIYFTMLFGVGMPLLYISAFVSFAVLFWSYKYIFISFCQRPLTYNHSINKTMRKIIFGSLILHCIFAPIFLRAPGIAGAQPQNIIQRLTSLWYYLLLMALLIVYLIFQNQIRIISIMLRQYLKKTFRKKTEKELEDQRKWKELKSRKLAATICRRNFSLPSIVRKRQNELQNESYSMHENEIYREILKTLYTINNKQRARKSFVLNSDLRHLYLDNIINSGDEDSQYRTLVEVIRAVRKDYKKFTAQHGKTKNPYQNSKNKLYQIYENTKQSQNRKYTLYYADSFQKKLSKQMIDEDEMNDNQLQSNQYLGTKQIFIGKNLQKVMQQPQDLQKSDGKSKNQDGDKFDNNLDNSKNDSHITKKSKKVNNRRLRKQTNQQIPPISEDRLKQREV